jgi:hypothetical protein
MKIQENMKMNESNVTRLTQLIIEADQEIESITPYELAEYLAGRSVIAAPVEIGQEVYAGIPKCFTDEESCVYAWKVKGVGIDEKGRYVAFNSYGEHYTVGDVDCRLTIAEAEEDIKKFEAEYTKEDAKDE